MTSLQPTRGSHADFVALGQRTRDKLRARLEKLRARGYNTDTGTWIINVFSRECHGMRGPA